MKWITIYNKPYIGFTLEKASYFDERPLVTTSITQIIAFITILILCFFSWWALVLTPLTLIGWGKSYISLPIYTGIDSCDNPMWGIKYSLEEKALFIYKGSNGRGGYKVDIYNSPFTYKHYSTQVYLKGGRAIPEKHLHLFKGNDDQLLPDCCVLQESIYTDFDGTEVPVRIGAELLEYRCFWAKKYQMRAVLDFAEEVGKEKGSYKGGVCFINLPFLEGETINQLLERKRNEL